MRVLRRRGFTTMRRETLPTGACGRCAGPSARGPAQSHANSAHARSRARGESHFFGRRHLGQVATRGRFLSARKWTLRSWSKSSSRRSRCAAVARCEAQTWAPAARRVQSPSDAPRCGASRLWWLRSAGCRSVGQLRRLCAYSSFDGLGRRACNKLPHRASMRFRGG